MPVDADGDAVPLVGCWHPRLAARMLTGVQCGGQSAAGPGVEQCALDAPPPRPSKHIILMIPNDVMIGFRTRRGHGPNRRARRARTMHTRRLCCSHQTHARTHRQSGVRANDVKCFGCYRGVRARACMLAVNLVEQRDRVFGFGWVSVFGVGRRRSLAARVTRRLH